MREVDQGSETRRQVLHLLRQQGGMTAQQLASQVKITSMGVRRHLMALERDGLVRVQLQRLPAGRPAYVYQLTDAGYDTFPRNYDLLATQLLDGVRAREGEAKIQEMFSARMEQLVAQYDPRMRGKDLAERVAELARIQEESGYMAVWEKVEGGYLLKEQNCAIYRVACRFQEACQYEIELFRRLLGVPIERVSHQVAGDNACAYFVGDRPPEERPRPSRKPASARPSRK